MVKICPTCKKFVPLSASACPICGNTKLMVSNTPATTAVAAPPTATKAKEKKSKAPIIVIALILVSVAIFVVTQFFPLNIAFGKSEAAIHADRTIEAIGEVTIDSEKKILEAEKAVSALSDKEYGQLENLQVLKDARAKYDELKDAVLDGDDKIAYDLILLYAGSFKNPPSIRLVSGTIAGNGKTAFLCISATNSFGATTNGYYFLTSAFINEVNDFDEPGSISLCKTKGELDVEKINRALSQELG